MGNFVEKLGAGNQSCEYEFFYIYYGYEVGILVCFASLPQGRRKFSDLAYVCLSCKCLPINS